MNKLLPTAEYVQVCIAPVGFGIRDSFAMLADARTAWVMQKVRCAATAQTPGVRCATISAHSVHKFSPEGYDLVVVEGRLLRGPKLREKIESFCRGKRVVLVYSPHDLPEDLQFIIR